MLTVCVCVYSWTIKLVRFSIRFVFGPINLIQALWEKSCYKQTMFEIFNDSHALMMFLSTTTTAAFCKHFFGFPSELQN